MERPDGSVDELVAPTQGAASVTFARTDLLGVYSVTPLAVPDASAAPSGGPSPGSSAGTASPASPASDGGSPGAPTFRPPEAGTPTRFAVDLLDVDESLSPPATRRG